MGLSVCVGWLARAAREDGDAYEVFVRPYRLLNEVLAKHAMDPHQEPLDIPDDQIFDAEMWGYGGLHAIRRLAAYHACEGRLPPLGRGEYDANDPMIGRLNRQYASYFRRKKYKILNMLPYSVKQAPKFQHLLLHSDCEGFYLPRDFEDVLFDGAIPQREGVGGMVGSSVRLLSECRELAELISLPRGIDPESEGIWENAENPPPDGELREVYGVEAFGLARLIRGCELSIEKNAALVFA